MAVARRSLLFAAILGLVASNAWAASPSLRVEAPRRTAPLQQTARGVGPGGGTATGSRPDANRAAPRASAITIRTNVRGTTSRALLAKQSEVWGTTGHELLQGRVERVNQNAAHGVMGSKIIEITLQNGRRVRAIFKPVSGEKNWGQYAKGTLFNREIAASVLSDELGFNLVPPTVPMTIDGEIGSAQLMVEDAPTAGKGTRGLQPESMKLFDYLIWNRDRHGENWLRPFDRKEVAIDHGLTFPSTARQARLTLPVVEADNRRILAQANPAKLARALADAGLDDPAIKGMLTRLEQVRAANDNDHVAASADQIVGWISAAHAK